MIATIPLGRTGERVSSLALGCMLMGTATGEPESFSGWMGLIGSLYRLLERAQADNEERERSL